MKQQKQHNLLKNYDLETVAPAGIRSHGRQAHREIVAGSGPHLSQETIPLLRQRLGGAALMLLIGFALFLVRHLVGVYAGERLDRVLLACHFLVTLTLAACFFGLRSGLPLSGPQLRLAELLVFGLPAAFFLLLQRYTLLQDAARGTFSAPSPFWLLLIFTHALFIPNCWRRSAVIVGGMALAPLCLMAGGVAVYPHVAACATGVEVLQHALVMLIAAVAAVFGAQTMSNLRQKAFEARQLGQYRLVSQIGVGGMGEVYLAEHCMLKRPCALKLIRPERAGDAQVLARFEREVRAMARLSHWNIVEVFDYGRTEDGTFFYVMEYLPGASLEELLQSDGPLPAERVIFLLRQACRGLREAHASGMIHRDIKPGNIFAACRGGMHDVVKLLDFGLVKQVAESSSARITQEGAISGTPLFMSPEQASGADPVDERSDIYSLGAVAYALATGKPPFERRSALEVLIAHARDRVVPPSDIWPEVPADLESVILRCLAKNPDDRFQSVEQLEQALGLCAAADRWNEERAAEWWRNLAEHQGSYASIWLDDTSAYEPVVWSEALSMVSCQR
jgi:serine/threonine-protein kinase